MLPLHNKAYPSEMYQSGPREQHVHEGAAKSTDDNFPISNCEKDVFCKILSKRKIEIHKNIYTFIFPVEVKGHNIIFWDEHPKSSSFFDRNEKATLFSKHTSKKNYQMECEERIEKIFSLGHDSVIVTYDEKGLSTSTKCHQFVNYIAFGLDNQTFIDSIEWYQTFTKAKIMRYDKEKLQWGDIIQLLSKDRLVHSMFYLGDEKVIHKIGGRDQSIAITNLTDATGIYMNLNVDHLHIVRVSDQSSKNP